ncbi:hypothetical protein [Nocardioides rubriscoriae]|uniref:hypothetical protein n=1 Tax=Nocardioides rubriscoriae TaxID=642762 RepID=UPI0011DFFEAE|nr:hypothetical protein [Nocardioides rubriscoriae]
MRRLRGRRAERLAAAEAAADARRDAYFGPLLAARTADVSGAAARTPEASLPAGPVVPVRPRQPVARRDPLLDPDHTWQDEPAPCADLVAVELGIDPETGAAIAPDVAALMQGATASQWCDALDAPHDPWPPYAAHA